jgi:hypothetical protein
MSGPWEDFAPQTQSGPWDDFRAPVESAPPKPPAMESASSAIMPIIHEMARGITFGQRDKIAAAVSAALGNSSYKDALSTEEQQGEQFRQEHPYISGAANVAGQMMPVMAGSNLVTKGLSALGPAGRFVAGVGGKTTLGKMASSAVGGALQGAGVGALPLPGAEGTTGERALKGALVGGGVGAAIPAGFALGRGIRNSFVGAKGVTPDRAELAKKAVEEYGIPITMSDIQPGMPASKWTSSMLDYLPFSGSAQRREQLQQAINKAVARSFGGDATGNLPAKITPKIMAGARARIGVMYDKALAGAKIRLDDELLNGLASLDDTVTNSALAEHEINAVRRQINRIQNIAADNGGQLPAELYQEFRKNKSVLSRLVNSDGPIAPYARELKSHLDEAFARTNPERAEIFRSANSQWRAMKAIEPEVRTGTPGDIRPGMIQNAANRAYPDRAWNTEPTILGDLGDISKAFLQRLPESGTAPRLTIAGLAGKASALGGQAAIGGGAAAAASGGGVAPLLAGAGLAVGGGRAASSVLNSKALRQALIAAALRNETPTAIEKLLAPVAPYAPGMLALPGPRRALLAAPGG